MSKTFGILNFGHCYLFDICYLGFVILYFHYSSIPTFQFDAMPLKVRVHLAIDTSQI